MLPENPEGAIDSTGFETHHLSAHYLHRQGKRTDHYTDWPKVTAICETQTHLFFACIVTRGPNNDAPHFRPALLQADRYVHFDRILGDAGFDAEPNHRLAREELGIRSTVIPINPRRGVGESPQGKYRSQMARCFPCRLYHNRLQIESNFSRHKRLLGSALRSRSRWSRVRECYLRILTHNAMILRRAA
jgi:hypothetical protein